MTCNIHFNKGGFGSLHFFGYRACDADSSNFGRDTGSSDQRIDTGRLTAPDGVPTRLVFLNGKDEYRVIWDPSRFPRSYEIFVSGKDRRGIIQISRTRNGSLSVVARAISPERDHGVGAPMDGDLAGAVWALGAREDARLNPSGGDHEVRIDLSRDSGATWESLFREPPTGAPETWSVSGPMKENCRIRISTL